MAYSSKYTDEMGEVRTVSITEEDSVEALKNDWEELKRRYNPKYVTIERLKAGEGEAMHVRLTVKAPSHFLTTLDDENPKRCSSMTADIICYPGYPLTCISASYAKDRYLASPNVFRFGKACIDTWIPFTSSLLTVADKLARDMIHDPSVTRYDSMANSSMEEWHKEKVADGSFPTIPPKQLYAIDIPSLPARKRSVTRPVSPPSLPRSRYRSKERRE